MEKNMVKDKISRREPVFGLVCNLGSTKLAEMYGLSGFDFVIFDREHGSFSLETLEELNRAAKLKGLTPFARVTQNDPKEVLRALDAGCMGVMVPQIETREDAELAVMSTKYPPEGIRGSNWKTVAAEWGTVKPSDYFRAANENIMTILLVETRKGVENIEEILTVPGIDIVMLGTSDLSSSMGYMGDPSHPDVQEAVRRVALSAKKAGVPTGGGAVLNKEKIRQNHENGMVMFFISPGDFIVKRFTEFTDALRSYFV